MSNPYITMRGQGTTLRSPRQRVLGFLQAEHGLAVTEYGLLVSLIAVAVLVAVFLFGQAIVGWFGSKTGQITSY
jgi:Flp pilus assembly pilin Flp